MRWRWDQGRLEYLRFDNVKKIAKALYSLDGISLSGTDVLRQQLEEQTGLPYSPRGYSVWRNYGRTFECALLAAKSEGHMKVTEICKNLSVEGRGELSADEYFMFLIRRFYLPFPGFQVSAETDQRVFPFCAIIRYLMAKSLKGEETSATLEEIFSVVIGNDVNGSESLSFLAALNETGRTPAGDERRQVREMMITISQCSFLSWMNKRLCLDIEQNELLPNLKKLDAMIMPDSSAHLADKGRELLRLGRIGAATNIPEFPEKETTADMVFTEGGRTARYHLMIERNGSLRKAFFGSRRPPFHCDVCRDIVNSHYPWVENILQLHHILPLSSPLRTNLKGTLLGDLVAVCPTCHNAIHRYYRSWLNQNHKEDFSSDTEAKNVYNEVRENYSS